MDMKSGMKSMSKKWFEHTPFIGDDEDDNQLHDDFHYEFPDKHVFIDESYSKLTNITLTHQEWDIVRESLKFVYESTTMNTEALDKILNELDKQLCKQRQNRPWSC